VEHLTDEGMSGRLAFGESLSRRLALFEADRTQVAETVAVLRKQVSPSFREHIGELNALCENLYVVSNGFSDCIVPVVAEFGIGADRVRANSFEYNGAGTITGCDRDNPLAHDGGKVRVVRELDLPGQKVMVGDGFSDLQVAKAGVIQTFIAYVESTSRPEVVAGADAVASDFGEVMTMLRKLARAQS
jgi:D-3-phosphoglycerate dehydrogenase